MDPVSIVALVTALLPFITTGVKKLFKTHELPEGTRQGVNALLPMILGVASAGLTAYANGATPAVAIAVGLGAGGVASSARDIDKNLLGIVEAAKSLSGGRKPADGEPPAAPGS